MIPKIIHQVYVKQKSDSVFPKEYARCQKTVFEHHPDFEYKLYDENDMENVLQCGQLNDPILEEKGCFTPDYYIIMDYNDYCICRFICYMWYFK